MINLAKLFKDYNDAGALNEHINLYGFVSDQVFLTKSGDLGVVVQVEGIDYECLDENPLDNMTRRLEVAQKVFDPQFRIYQYLLKRNNATIPYQLYDNEVVNQAIRNRMAHLQSQAETLFSISIYYVILYDQDAVKIDKAVSEFFKIFSTHDAVLYDERYNLLNAYLAIVPGNYHLNLRRMYILNTNYADYSFFFTLHQGDQHNHHLDKEYLAILESTQQTPYYFNLHDQDLAHTMVLGKTGSGKSFLLNFLLTNLQKYDPYTSLANCHFVTQPQPIPGFVRMGRCAIWLSFSFISLRRSLGSLAPAASVLSSRSRCWSNINW
jgi:type IV secretory pathway VirB4 component